MSLQVFAHDGKVLFEGLWSAMTAAKSFSPYLLSPPKDATHWVRYTTGGTAALVRGETLTGGTSDETATLVAQAVEVGTAGSSDTGILFLSNVSGAFTATGETLTGTSTGTVAIAQAPIAIPRPIPPHPKALLITVETAPVHVTLSGTTPTATAGTNHGTTLTAGQSWVIRGIDNIRNFKVINETNANNALLKYALYF